MREWKDGGTEGRSGVEGVEEWREGVGEWRDGRRDLAGDGRHNHVKGRAECGVESGVECGVESGMSGVRVE